MYTVGIIGAGASGMMAALTAAGDKNNKVILFERQNRVGRKLAATGNGRCNLTNINAAGADYRGNDPAFAGSVLSRFTPEDTLNFFHSLGLLTVTEYGGRVYPLSNSANSVVDVLRFALESAGVDLRSACPVRNISRADKGYVISTDEEIIRADYLIVACGGAAGAKLGGVTDGYELLSPLGHKRTKLAPSLVQILCDGDYPKALKGIRAQGAVSLMYGEETVGQSRGEIQFIENGLSGPAVFDISSDVARYGAGGKIKIDFLWEYTLPELINILSARREKSSPFREQDCGELLTGIVHNRLGRMLVKYCSIAPTKKISSLNDEEIKAVALACKGFCLDVKGTEGFDSAQVTAGGIKTGGFNPETLESWFMPGLFVCGELLDVDARCGGYNLQWAWASGYVAGRLGK